MLQFSAFARYLRSEEAGDAAAGQIIRRLLYAAVAEILAFLQRRMRQA
jgi:hypothetical protein